MSALAVRGIAKRFGTIAVLNDIALDVAPGEFMVLLGPSGCGKSTLLNIVAGLDAADAGRIVIGGEDVTDREPRDRDIAMVFQSYALYPTMSVRRNMAFGLRMRGTPRAEADRRVEDAARLLQIDALLERRPGQLSGGQRQRVAIGRAIVRQPKIFLFDEPLSNLDAKLRAEMRIELKELHRRLGATIVHVTHDQVEAMTLATRIAVMKDGVIEQIGAPQEVYDRPASVFVAGFTGAPAMNLLSGCIVENAAGLGFRADGAAADIALAALWNGAMKPGQRVLFGIRPEDIAPAGADAPCVIELEKLLVEPTGADSHVIFRLGHARITGRFKPAEIPCGERAPVALDIARASFFDGETGRRLRWSDS
jgi:multiple sugar transport system ATP-binding protein